MKTILITVFTDQFLFSFVQNSFEMDITFTAPSIHALINKTMKGSDKDLMLSDNNCSVTKEIKQHCTTHTYPKVIKRILQTMSKLVISDVNHLLQIPLLCRKFNHMRMQTEGGGGQGDLPPLKFRNELFCLPVHFFVLRPISVSPIAIRFTDLWSYSISKTCISEVRSLPLIDENETFSHSTQ